MTAAPIEITEAQAGAEVIEQLDEAWAVPCEAGLTCEKKRDAVHPGGPMRNPECRGCGITPADMPDEVMEQFEDDFEDGLCPACQLQPAGGTWTADSVDMGEGAALDESEPAPLFCGMPCLGSCEETCPYNDAEEDL